MSEDQTCYSNDQIEHLFVSFSAFLTSERNSTRFPHGLRQFLQTVRSEQTVPASTPRIFLDHGGIQALVAYFVVKPGTAHASGNEALRRRFAELDNLSVTDREQLAQRIRDLDVHSTVGDLIQQLEHQTMGEQPEAAGPRPSKRPRTNEHAAASSDSVSLITDQVQEGRATDLSTVHPDNPAVE
ncbi:hypothetical protein CEP54_004605 [Fusarium duplospermum]|uniref:Uncharacterized protein n=1 Tax=Fusarium duplospermum TaxID=1325734 RepID=A0A428QHH8_9HYPO|nr:hypothetical protein CEP54_004605 [Fusarium duplospermum]